MNRRLNNIIIIHAVFNATYMYRHQKVWLKYMYGGTEVEAAKFISCVFLHPEMSWGRKRAKRGRMEKGRDLMMTAV